VLDLDGVAYSLDGDGPAIVVPQCNVDWSAVDLTPLSSRCTVVTVAPRGFSPSVRQGGYSGAGMRADVERVLDHLGLDGYLTFGYSLNGAMAAWLGVDNPRVLGVVCGGFPTSGSYDGLADRMRGILDRARADDAAWSEVVATYDPEAVVAFYEDLGRLEPGALLDRLRCPVWQWWGSADEVFADLGGLDEHQHGLEERGLPFDVLAGLDHGGALDRLDLALPGALAWLDGLGR
jgi:pimeloyl-ACP methyl ester carboxylesterase